MVLILLWKNYSKDYRRRAWGKKALSSRNNWQTQSGPGGLAGTAEKIYILCSKEHLKEPFMK